MPSLVDYDLSTLQAELAGAGHKPVHAINLLRHFYARNGQLDLHALEIGRGVGEQLLNFDNVVAAIRRIADPNLGGLGWRQITVSTVGIVPAIDRLAELDLNVHLAVSLHAPDDATRSRLVPMNRRHAVADVMNA